MVLKCFGCSFVFGSELPDLTLAWPSLIAKELDLEYQCLAYPGKGNLFIADRILNFTKPDDFVVVHWTYIDRFDYAENHGLTNLDWKSTLPNNIEDQFYYKKYQCDYVDKLRTLITIKYTIDYLKTSGIRFFMSYHDALLFDQKFHTSLAIQTLQEQIKPYLFDFTSQNFVEWARSRGHQVSEQGHLLTSGHRAVADYLLPQINTIIIQESKNELSI